MGVFKGYSIPDRLFFFVHIQGKSANTFIELANSYHPTIKFTAEISDTEITFLDTCVYKGKRLPPFSLILDHQNKTPAETFPKFPSIIHVIDRSDQNPPITARYHDVKKVCRSH